MPHEPSDAVSRGARRMRAAAVAAGVLAACGLTAMHGVPGAPASAGAPPSGWRYARSWPLPDLPHEPLDVAVLPGDGSPDVVVADGRNRRVLVFRAGDTEPSAVWDPPPGIAGLSPFTDGRPTRVFPLAVAADPRRERVYVAWAEIGHDPPAFRGFSPLYLETRHADGTPLGLVRRSPGYLLDGRLGAIVDLAVGAADGDVHLSVGGHVERIDPATGATVPLARLGPEDELLRMAIAPDGSYIVAGPSAGIVVRFDERGRLSGNIDLSSLGRAPVAVDVDAAGIARVLLAGVPGPDGSLPVPGEGIDEPVIVELAADLAILRTRSASELGVAAPIGPWPWALSIAGAGPEAGLAFTAGGPELSVERFAGRWERQPPLRASTADDVAAWAPRLDDDGLAFGAGIALAAGNAPLGASVAALDNRLHQVLAYGDAGDLIAEVPAPADAIDIANDHSGRLYASTESGGVLPLPVTGGEPVWRAEVRSSYGGRLATWDGLVWASEARYRGIAGLRTTDGALDSSIERPDAIGLWPTDLASAPGIGLIAADLVDSSAAVVAGDGGAGPGPDPRVPLGLAAGPLRIDAAATDGYGVLLAALTADGMVEVHQLGAGGAWLAARWRPQPTDAAAEAGAASDPGEILEVDDIAIDARGTVYLSSRRPPAVHVWEALPHGATATPPPAGTPTPVATATPGGCVLEGDKIAGPPRLVLGEQAAVTITLRADCPGRTLASGADIVLIVDRSGSMDGAPLAAARSAAGAFAAALDVRDHRVALVSFAEGARLDAELAPNALPVLDALDRLAADGGTDIAGALDTAAAHLAGAGRPDALGVIVLLTDGRQTEYGDPIASAAASRAAGVRLYTVGLGFDADADMLRGIAGADERFRLVRRSSDLLSIYREILTAVVTSFAGRVEIDDEIAADVSLIPGSVLPPAIESLRPARLRWGRGILPADGMTLTYRVLPLVTGTVPLNRYAFAEIDDGEGSRLRLELPVPKVIVVAPTPSPSPPPEATSTPAPPPGPIHLPFALQGYCLPRSRGIDAVLLLDTSSSMSGAKLESAKSAAGRFLDTLELEDGADRASVIGFDATPWVAAALTRDTADLRAALGALASGTGTRIDRALRAAAGELAAAPRPRGERVRSVIILLSDGVHGGDVRPVLDLAAGLRAADVQLYVIGLGLDADHDLLRAVADPGAYLRAPSTAELDAAYASIAALIPCR